MCEVLDDTAAQVILALENDDSIRRVAQHLHAPYETIRLAVNRVEDTGYISMRTVSTSPMITFEKQHES